MRTTALPNIIASISDFGFYTSKRFVVGVYGKKDIPLEDYNTSFIYLMTEDKNASEHLTAINKHLCRLLQQSTLFEKLQNWHDFLQMISHQYPEKKPAFIAKVSELVDTTLEKAILLKRCGRFKMKLTLSILNQFLTSTQLTIRGIDNLPIIAASYLIALKRKQQNHLSPDDSAFIQTIEAQVQHFQKKTGINFNALIKNRSFCEAITQFNELDRIMESLLHPETQLQTIYDEIKQYDSMQKGLLAEIPTSIVPDDFTRCALSELTKARSALIRSAPTTTEAMLHAIDDCMLTLERELKRNTLARRLTFESFYIKLEMLKQQMVNLKQPSKLAKLFRCCDTTNPVRTVVVGLQQELSYQQKLQASIADTPKSDISNDSDINFRMR